MMVHLCVRSAFGDFAKGAVISDVDQVKALQEFGQADMHCVAFDGDAEHLTDEFAQSEAEAHAKAQG